MNRKTYHVGYNAYNQGRLGFWAGKLHFLDSIDVACVGGLKRKSKKTPSSDKDNVKNPK